MFVGNASNCVGNPCVCRLCEELSNTGYLKYLVCHNFAPSLFYFITQLANSSVLQRSTKHAAFVEDPVLYKYLLEAFPFVIFRQSLPAARYRANCEPVHVLPS